MKRRPPVRQGRRENVREGTFAKGDGGQNVREGMFAKSDLQGHRRSVTLVILTSCATASFKFTYKAMSDIVSQATPLAERGSGHTATTELSPRMQLSTIAGR